MPGRVAIAALALGLAAFAAWPGGSGRARPGPPVVSVAVASGASIEVTTGFGVGNDLVATVAHVFERRGERALVGGEGRTRRQARVVMLDRRNDLALLSAPGLGAPRLRLGDRRDELRLHVRRPDGDRALTAQLRRPIRARVAESGLPGRRERRAYELAAAVRIGDSGAPLVDSRGRVVGVLFARSRERPGTAYAVAAEPLLALLSAAGSWDARAPR